MEAAKGLVSEDRRPAPWQRQSSWSRPVGLCKPYFATSAITED